MAFPEVPVLGFVALGKMGGNLARQALAKKMRIVGLTLGEAPPDLGMTGPVSVKTPGELAAALPAPPIVFLYIPADKGVDEMLDSLGNALGVGDIIADGGNSYWGGSIRRHARLRNRGIHFVDLGTSGGPGGALDGACFMVGGDDEAVGRLEPILRPLAVKDGFVHAGPAGSGHFVKLVHNGIEFGMLQAIGEGIDLLEHYREKLPISEVPETWRHGSVVRSWLIDLIAECYREAGGLGRVPAYVDDTGEVNWLVDDALHLDVPIPVIAQSVLQLVSSRDGRRSWARTIAMMRHGFGGHPYGANDAVTKEHRTGRVGGFPEEIP